MEILMLVALGLFFSASLSIFLALKNIEKHLAKISDGMVEVAGREGYLPETVAALNRIATTLQERSLERK